MIALNEINCLRLAVCLIHRGMIARTGSGDYKLFNFLNLHQYDTLINEISTNFPNFVERSKTKVGPYTDTWTLGVFMAMFFKAHTFDFRHRRFTFDYFYDFPQDSVFNPAEKEIFQATLSRKPQKRIGIQDTIHLNFFTQIMRRYPILKQKALQCKGVRGKANLTKLLYKMRMSVISSDIMKASAYSRKKSALASPKSSVVRFIPSASDKESLAKTANPRQVKEQLSTFFDNDEKEFQQMRKSQINRRRSISGWAQQQKTGFRSTGTSPRIYSGDIVKFYSNKDSEGKIFSRSPVRAQSKNLSYTSGGLISPAMTSPQNEDFQFTSLNQFDNPPKKDNTMTDLEKRIAQYQKELKLSMINETRKTLQESSGHHELKRPTGNFGKPSKYSNNPNEMDSSENSSQKMDSIENALQKEGNRKNIDISPRHRARNKTITSPHLKPQSNLKKKGPSSNKKIKSKVKFGTVTDQPPPKSTPRKRDRRGHRQGTRTAEKEYGSERRKLRVTQLPEDKGKKKKKGFFGNFMEMIGFGGGCCGTR